ADTTPPTVSNHTPPSNATGVDPATTVTATFSEAVQSSTISFVLKDAANNTVAASLGYNSSTLTATLTPSAPLAANTTYTAAVAGARDPAGNTMPPLSWSFTTSNPDTTPPTVTSHAPASGATGVSASTAVTATFSEAVQSSTIVFTLQDSVGNAVAA